MEVVVIVTGNDGGIGLLLRIPHGDRSAEVLGGCHIVQVIVAQVGVADKVPAGILRIIRLVC